MCICVYVCMFVYTFMNVCECVCVYVIPFQFVSTVIYHIKCR